MALRTAKDAELFRAKQRIQTLEQEGEREKLERVEAEVRRLEEEVAERVIECEGWEAEANRLGNDVEGALEMGRKRGREEGREEVERARAEVEAQKRKRKAGKLLIGRLRLEMDARRLKEKWDLAVMDAMDRTNEAATVGLEYDLAMATHRREMDEFGIEELEVCSPPFLSCFQTLPQGAESRALRRRSSRSRRRRFPPSTSPEPSFSTRSTPPNPPSRSFALNSPRRARRPRPCERTSRNPKPLRSNRRRRWPSSRSG